MELTFVIVLLFVLTSTVGYGVAHQFRPMSGKSLFQAVGELLDWAGLFTLFTGANVALGVLFIFAIRGFTSRFVSLYSLEDVLLLILSAAQAFVFHQWWKRA